MYSIHAIYSLLLEYSVLCNVVWNQRYWLYLDSVSLSCAAAALFKLLSHSDIE